MRFFLAGIIQGSKDRGIHGQDYRQQHETLVHTVIVADPRHTFGNPGHRLRSDPD